MLSPSCCIEKAQGGMKSKGPGRDVVYRLVIVSIGDGFGGKGAHQVVQAQTCNGHSFTRISLLFPARGTALLCCGTHQGLGGNQVLYKGSGWLSVWGFACVPSSLICGRVSKFSALLMEVIHINVLLPSHTSTHN